MGLGNLFKGILSDEAIEPKKAPAPPPPVRGEDEDVKAAQQAKIRKLRAQKGRQGTLLAGNPISGTKSLLGE